MLLAYSLTADGLLTAETIDAIRRTEEALGAELLGTPDLALGWHHVAPGPVEGTFVRGYAHTASRGRALALIEALRRLSREFPGVAVLVSGWGDLPMTTIRAGEFEMFADVYVRALKLDDRRAA